MSSQRWFRRQGVCGTPALLVNLLRYATTLRAELILQAEIRRGTVTGPPATGPAARSLSRPSPLAQRTTALSPSGTAKAGAVAQAPWAIGQDVADQPAGGIRCGPPPIPHAGAFAALLSHEARGT